MMCVCVLNAQMHDAWCRTFVVFGRQLHRALSDWRPHAQHLCHCISSKQQHPEERKCQQHQIVVCKIIVYCSSYSHSMWLKSVNTVRQSKTKKLDVETIEFLHRNGRRTSSRENTIVVNIGTPFSIELSVERETKLK